MRRMSFCVGLLSLNLISGVVLVSSFVSATDDEVVDSVQLAVPIACTMTGAGTTHTATLNPGTYSGESVSEYENGIGKTTLTAICNDDNGFAIHAIGYTGNSYDSENHTKLVGSNTGGVITTKAYASGDTASNWSMKLTKVTNPVSGDPVTYNPDNLTITTGYDTWHAVPDTFAKVAEYHANTGSSTTDTTLGVKLETTYAAYIATNQPADTYIGQVKYTMVHPYNEEPLQPQASPSGKICYYANASDAEGTMGCQTISDYAKDWGQCINGTDYSSYCYDSNYNDIISSLPNTNTAPVTLLASNFSRTSYGFAGWSDKFDYATNNEAHFYGPQETITIPDTSIYTGEGKGLSLYAVWVKSQGNLQDTTKVAGLCGTGQGSLTTAPTGGMANLASVSALTDQRDNNTYAIAKLADGNCWMIENLRLESTAEHNSDGSLAQGYGTSATYGNFGGLANAESANFSESTTANSLYYSGTQSGDATINIGTSNYPGRRMPRYNNTNTSTRASNPTNNSGNMYSYGNYYTWHAAIADLTYNGTNNQSTTGTSLCPTGWHLPKGGDKTNEANNELWSLVVDGINEGTKPASYDGSTTPIYNGTPEGYDASNKLRAYPNNFLYSGNLIASSVYSRGSIGLYWSSTAKNYYASYFLFLYSSSVYPGTYGSDKNVGQSIRCTVDS